MKLFVQVKGRISSLLFKTFQCHHPDFQNHPLCGSNRKDQIEDNVEKMIISW